MKSNAQKKPRLILDGVLPEGVKSNLIFGEVKGEPVAVIVPTGVPKSLLAADRVVGVLPIVIAVLKEVTIVTLLSVLLQICWGKQRQKYEDNGPTVVIRSSR